jgi:hypothetical protein
MQFVRTCAHTMTVIAFSIALPALILFTWARLLRFAFLNASGLGDIYVLVLRYSKLGSGVENRFVKV